MINKKLWVSIATCLAAAVLLAGLSMDLLPSTVSAANYSEPEEQNETQPPETVAQIQSVVVLADQVMSIGDTIETEAAVEDPQNDPAWFAEMESALLNKSVKVEEPFRYPLARRVYISSPFGMRMDPVYGYYRMHNGIDLAGRTGDDVLASRSGTVITATYSESCGYYVEIDHGDGYITQYLHLSRYVVKVGQKVSAGERIGDMGSTGYSTGPHLHFGISYNGQFVNPADYIDFTY